VERDPSVRDSLDSGGISHYPCRQRRLPLPATDAYALSSRYPRPITAPNFSRLPCPSSDLGGPAQFQRAKITWEARNQLGISQRTLFPVGYPTRKLATLIYLSHSSSRPRYFTFRHRLKCAAPAGLFFISLSSYLIQA